MCVRSMDRLLIKSNINLLVQCLNMTHDDSWFHYAHKHSEHHARTAVFQLGARQGIFARLAVAVA